MEQEFFDSLHDLVAEVKKGVTEVENFLAKHENANQGADVSEAQEAAKTSATNTAATATSGEEETAPVAGQDTENGTDEQKAEV